MKKKGDMMGESVALFNKQGESLKVDLRFANAGDSENIISLLKNQHGTNYSKKMYDPDYLRNKIELGSLRVVLVESRNDGIVGIVGSNSENAFKGGIAFIMLVVNPRYRGFGLGKILQDFLLKSTEQDAYTCIYGHCMTVDTITQSNQLRFGYTFTGILLNCCIHDRGAEYVRDTNITLPFKDALVVACLSRAKRDAGLLYGYPYSRYISDVYTKLGVAYTLAEDVSRPDALVSDVFWEQDDDQKYAEFFTAAVGLDFADRIKKMIGQYPAREQSFNGFINLNDPGCPYACRILEDYGFFFSGLQPLSGRYEYAIMHYSPFLEVPFEKLAIVFDFKEQFDYIWDKYRAKKR
jgi:GNAT superfamily N-acetyltransferase